MNNLQILTPTDNAKEIGRAIVESICHDVAEGNVDPLKQLIVLKALDNAIDEIKQNIMSVGIEEVRKYGKEVSMRGLEKIDIFLSLTLLKLKKILHQ